MALYSGTREKKVLGQVASVAVALEALEAILIEKGLLKENEVMLKAFQIAKGKMAGANRLADDYSEVND